MRQQPTPRCPRTVLVALATLLGCAPAVGQSTIKVDGSMGSMPLVQALAKAFQAKQSETAFEFGAGLNPRARIEALAGGNIDIALASHGLNIEALTREGMQVTEIARTAVVFATNAGVGVDSLTDDQICRIFSGQVVNWKDLGGTDRVIAPRTRPESEIDTEVVRDGVGCLKNLAFAPTVKIVARSADMIKELTETSGAIGITTLTAVEQSGGRFRALALNGVAANETTVTTGQYRIVREVYLVVKNVSSPSVQQFTAFIRSPEGAAIIKANGALPTIH
jgi:phosphate transport system substrate-binding protein